MEMFSSHVVVTKRVPNESDSAPNFSFLCVLR